MWDSSKHLNTKESQDFDAYEDFLALCKDLNIESVHPEIVSYPVGWKDILAGFLTEVIKYPAIVTDVSDDYGQLEITFQMESPRNEVKVWRLVDRIRRESKRTCVECGCQNGLTELPVTRKKICKSCYRSFQRPTGTWLDKY